MHISGRDEYNTISVFTCSLYACAITRKTKKMDGTTLTVIYKRVQNS